MTKPGSWQGLRAGNAFALLAAAFVLAFAVLLLLIALDQQRVIDAISRLQAQTVPEIIRYQRLAHNLEQLQQQGERVFAASTPPARQQAMFVVTLVASHPSVLAHAESAELARQAERLLSEIVRQSVLDDDVFIRRFDEWQALTTRLGQLVEDVSVLSVNEANKDLTAVAAAMRLARIKLSLALLFVGVCLAAFLVLLRAYLIRPLQCIDHALAHLRMDSPAPEFSSSKILEIQRIETAIGELHTSLVNNEAARQALENLANKDGLTGLTNRRHFMLTADIELQRAQRYRRPVSVGMADLDFFKKINDVYGHAAGDTVLRAFAALVQDTLRQSDMVCRYGGEEFAFLFPESSIDETAKLAERIRARCADTDIALEDGRQVRVTLSIGLAEASDCTIESALKCADDALYTAKHEGRNRVVLAAVSPEESVPCTS